jgi:hypothetical protein
MNDRWKIRKSRPQRASLSTPWGVKHPFSDRWAYFGSWAEALRYAVDEKRDEVW